MNRMCQKRTVHFIYVQKGLSILVYIHSTPILCMFKKSCSYSLESRINMDKTTWTYSISHLKIYKPKPHILIKEMLLLCTI